MGHVIGARSRALKSHDPREDQPRPTRALQGLLARNEVGIPISYKGLDLDNSYRADLIVEDAVMLELKAVDLILPVHEAQLLTYLKHSRLNVGLLINFNVRQLTNGVRRFVRN